MPTHAYRQGKPVATRIEPGDTPVWRGEPLLQGVDVILTGGAGHPQGQGILEPESSEPAGPHEKEARNT